MNSDTSSVRLANLLDRIDQNKEKVAGSAPKVFAYRPDVQTSEWVEYVDPTTSKPYYYNVLSKLTQWEKPETLMTPTPPCSCAKSNEDLPTAKSTIQEATPTYSEGTSSELQNDLHAVLGTTPAAAPDISFGWVEYLDPNSKLPYYYNVILKITQWEKPKALLSIPESDQTGDVEYVEKAYFSKDSGRFSGTTSYWQKVRKLSVVVVPYCFARRHSCLLYA